MADVPGNQSEEAKQVRARGSYPAWTLRTRLPALPAQHEVDLDLSSTASSEEVFPPSLLTIFSGAAVDPGKWPPLLQRTTLEPEARQARPPSFPLEAPWSYLVTQRLRASTSVSCRGDS